MRGLHPVEIVDGVRVFLHTQRLREAVVLQIVRGSGMVEQIVNRLCSTGRKEGAQCYESGIICGVKSRRDVIADRGPADSPELQRSPLSSRPRIQSIGCGVVFLSVYSLV